MGSESDERKTSRKEGTDGSRHSPVIVTPAGIDESSIRTALEAIGADAPVFVLLDELEERTPHELSQHSELTEIDIERSSTGGAKRNAASTAHPADANGPSPAESNPRDDTDAGEPSRRSSETASSAGKPPAASRLVGIPVYNESAGIGSVVLAAQEHADEVVVVDDGSTDDTAEIARNAGATVLEHEGNRGKGRAMKTFLDYARSSDQDAYVVLDGDGQHLPRDIPSVCEPVERGDADLVIGSRYLDDRETENTPAYRRVGQWVLDVLTFGSSGVRLSDTQCGFRAFSPRAIESLMIRTDGMGVESEMISAATAKELRIEEVPIDIRYDGVDGQTFNPFRHGLSVATFLLKHVRDRHPLLVFGLPGIMLTAIGVAIGLDAVFVYNNSDFFPLGQTLLSMLVTVIGFLSAFFGLVLNRITSLRYELEEIV